MLLMNGTECKNSIVFGGGQMSLAISKGHTVRTCPCKVGEMSRTYCGVYICYHDQPLRVRNLLHLVKGQQTFTCVNI